MLDSPTLRPGYRGYRARLSQVTVAGGLALALTASLVAGLDSDTEFGSFVAAVRVATLPCDSASLVPMATGFIVSPGEVMTVAHTLYRTKQIGVQDKLGRWHDARVSRFDPTSDVATLLVDDLTVPIEARLDWDEPTHGEQVQLVDGSASGSLDGRVRRLVQAEVRNVGDQGEPTSVRAVIEVEMKVQPGDSGAALVNSAGAVVGMLFARSKWHEASAGSAWAVRSELLSKMVGGSHHLRQGLAHPRQLECGPSGAKLDFVDRGPATVALTRLPTDDRQ